MMWKTRGEYALYAACQGDSRFISPPGDDADEVERVCWSCKVRAECAAHTVGNEESGVWSASVWVPEISIGDSPRRAKEILIEAEKVRAKLAESIPGELERRGEF